MRDPLSDVLSLLQPHTYIAGGFDLGPRWSIGFQPHDGIKCYAMLSGACWLVLEDSAEPVRLEEGDCVLLPHGQRFRFASDVALRPTPFEALPIEWCGGIATIDGGGDALLLGGHFAFTDAHADVLLGAMPPIAHLQDSQEKGDLRWALERMRRELVETRPGGVLVAQHLAHLMLVQALRFYLSGVAGRHVGWLFALADPRLSKAIGAMHARPGARWSLPSLAERAGMSRSSFARTFKSTVGIPPLEYLTQWRMLLAGTRLVAGAERIAVIAASLGYDSETAFSTAFKRVMGCAPRQYARLKPPAPHVHPWTTTAIAENRRDTPAAKAR